MVRFPRLPLAAAALVLAVACSGDDLTPPAGGPLAEFSDGANAGNPDFFFLPPMFRSPTNHPNFTAGAFNAQLQPRVEICRLEFLPDNSLACVAGPPVQVFEGAAIAVSTADEQYQVNWNTDESALELDAYYRIEVFAGGTSLGFADMDPVGTGRELRNVQTGEYIGLVDGRTLPIKFRIESGALCDPPGSSPCTSQTIDLSETSVVVLEETGDQVTIPAQNTLEGEITVTLERCEDEDGNPTSIDVDLPVFGNCLRITTDRELDAPLSPPATVSMCRLLDVLPELSEEQRHLLTLHRQDGDVIQALPHAPEDFCPGVGDIGAAPGTGLRGFAATGWRLIRRGFAAVFAPKTLYARTVMLDVGELGGFTQDFSDFQFALPAKMTYVNPDDASRSAPPGTTLPAAVVVTDAHGDAVAGATVRFIVPAIEGPSSLLATALTGADGIAQADWMIESGPNSLIASARGIANPGNDGPAEGFDPFTPLVDPDMTPEERALQDPVTLGVGAVPFSATGETLTPTATSLASGVPLAGVDFTVPLEATVTPAPPAGAIVEFFEGETSLGTALTNEAGRATRSVTLNGVLARQFFTARFTGTTSHGASTSPVAVQEKWQHFDDAASFTAGLRGAVTETQDFEGLDLGTAVSTVIGSVLNVTSPFPTLAVFTCETKCLFGSGGDVRGLGNGQYDLEFLAPRNAIAFDLASQDPATGPASIQIFAALAGITLGERNLGADEATPNFFGIILTVPIQRVLVLEGPEVTGSGNEEIGLDNFIIATVPFSP